MKPRTSAWPKRPARSQAHIASIAALVPSSGFAPLRLHVKLTLDRICSDSQVRDQTYGSTDQRPIILVFDRYMTPNFLEHTWQTSQATRLISTVYSNGSRATMLARRLHLVDMFIGGIGMSHLGQPAHRRNMTRRPRIFAVWFAT